MAMTLVVMAAGRGSRFGGMKQVAGIGPAGEALFDYAVYDALRSGFDDVVFVVSEESSGPVQAHVEAGCGRHVEVRYALQEAPGRTKPWGTGHALLCASTEVSGPFGVANADDFYGGDSFELLGRSLDAHPEDHVLVGFGLRESLSPNGGVSRGVCRHEDDMLTEITELHDVEEVGGEIRSREGVALSGDELISANLWGFQPSFAKILGVEFDRFLAERGDEPDAEFLIGDAVASLPQHGDARVRVVPTPEKFLGMTYAEDVAAVSSQIASLIQAGRYPSPLWA
ncbi:MAG TPA: NTP transferase domain-containing protein [Acidimicrobiales bacterium]|nr:NTP transferase domain-containing protein [Acidimicrobiales bacterium]